MRESYFEETAAVDTWRYCLRSRLTNEQNTFLCSFWIQICSRIQASSSYEVCGCEAFANNSLLSVVEIGFCIKA
jgi:hypothetical protein